VPLTAPPTPIAAAPAQAPALAEVTEGYAYDPKSRRDPFLSLTRLLKVDKTRAEMPPLQRVQISDLKLLGIMWGGYGYYGLVQTPDGKGYTVKEGVLMGTNNGIITTITDKAIIVSEPSIDIMGNKSTKDVEILLRPKEVS
jgi:type IV pilus assembly protein PilP